MCWNMTDNIIISTNNDIFIVLCFFFQHLALGYY